MQKPNIKQDTLLEGLSSFWQTVFADRNQLKQLYAATEVQLGQAYLDLLTQILNVSLDDIPVFNKEYWHLVTLRRDLTRTGTDATYPYVHPLPERLVSAPFLMNQVLAPTIILEHQVDYVVDVENQEIRFRDNPFGMAGMTSRQISVVPTLYAEGVSASFSLAQPSRLTVETRIDAGSGAVTYGTTTITLPATAKGLARVGDVITLLGGAIAVATSRTIVEVVSPAQVTVDATVTAETGLSWAVSQPTRFTAQDVNTQITMTDPRDRTKTQTRVIQSVVSPTVVEFTEAVTLFTADQQNIGWQHTSQERVDQVALWSSDALLDLDNLYRSFGSLLRRRDVSSERYKALIRGIWQLFVNGPALPRIESALNLFVGVPVVRSEHEYVVSVDTSAATVDVVVTSRTSYAVPKGSLKSQIVPNYVLKAFESLTTLFTLADNVSDPLWFYNKRIPPELVALSNTQDHPIDPQLYENNATLSRPLLVGEPRVFIGADENGAVIATISGKDGDVGDLPTDLAPALANQELLPALVGRELRIASTSTPILGLTISSGLVPQINSSVDISSLVASQSMTFLVESTGVATVLKTSGRSWRPSDIGRICKVTASSEPGFVGELLRVDALYGGNRAKLAPAESAFAGAYVAGQTMTVTALLDWEVAARGGLRHNLGFNVMADLVSRHTLYITYDLSQYEVPYLRTQEDVRAVLLASKPSYTYIYLEGGASVLDVINVADSITLGLQPIAAITNAQQGIQAGTLLSSYVYYAGNPFAWIDVVRDSELGIQTELLWADQADSLVFTAQFEGYTPGDAIDVSVAFHNGVSFVPAGVSFTLDPGVSNVFTMSAPRTRVAITATASGTATRACVVYGMAAEPAATIVGATPSVPASVTGSSAGGALFTDANFEFHDFDVYREIFIVIGGVERLYHIRGRTSAHVVFLVDAITNAPAVIPAAAGYTWTLGAPRRFATPVVIGGPNPVVTFGVSPYAYRLIDWPASITLQEPGTHASALGTAIFGASANATVS